MMAASLDHRHRRSSTFEEFLRQEQSKDLLRFTTAGSVDDGKSHADRAAAARRAGRLRRSVEAGDSRRRDRFFAADRRAARGARAGHHDRRRVPLFRDAEAQVHSGGHARPRAVHAQHGHRAHRRPSWPSFCWTPSRGITTQSMRHAYIASLLGIPHFVIAVNKMDLVGLRRSRFSIAFARNSRRS